MKCTSLTPTGKCGRTSKKMKTPTVAISDRTATEAMPAFAGGLGDVVKRGAACRGGGGVAENDLGPVDEARFDMHMSLLSVTPDGGLLLLQGRSPGWRIAAGPSPSHP